MAPDDRTDRAIERAVGALEKLTRERFDHLSTQIRGVNHRLDEIVRRDEMRTQDLEDLKSRTIGLEAVQSDLLRWRDAVDSGRRFSITTAVSVVALLAAVAGVIVAAA